MKKKIIPVIIAMTMAMSVNLRIVTAENEFTFENAETSGLQVNLTFSENVDKSTASAIKLSDAEGNQTDIENISVNKNVVSIPVEKTQNDEKGYIIIGKQLADVNGDALAESNVVEYSFLGNEEVYNEKSDWCCIGNYNDSMYNKPHTIKPPMNGSEIKVEKFVALSDFQNRRDINNEIIEFDYKYTNTYSPSATSFFSALFRMQDLGRQNQWNAIASGYGLSIFSDNGVTKLFLNKFIDNDVQYANWNANINLGNVSIKRQLNSYMKYRFKIECMNVDENVKIAVYLAEYSGNTVGNYTKLMEATDYSNVYDCGYFAFIGDANTGHSIADIHVLKGLESEIGVYPMTEIKAYLEKEIDTIPDASNVTQADFEKIPQMDCIINYLLENGCETSDIIGYDKYIEFKSWQLNVEAFSSETTPFKHILKYTLSADVDSKTAINDNVSVKKNGADFDDYRVYSNDSDLIVEIFNNRNYEGIFDVTLSTNIKSQKGFMLSGEYKNVFDEFKLSLPKVTLNVNEANDKVNADVKFMEKAEKSFAIVTITDENTKKCLSVKYITDNSNVEFDKPQDHYSVSVILFDNTESLKQIYKTLTIRK